MWYKIIHWVFGVICFCLLLSSVAQAQTDKCGTVRYNKSQNKTQFEQWIATKIAQKKGAQRRTQAEEIYRIPVVVHVIHRGEAVGEGANIPYEQVEDQIRILNEDYRRQNADTVDTPEEFLLVAMDTHIEFVLAQQDPEGTATRGVVRVEGPQNSYAVTDATILSEASYWDSERYLNIWVTPLSGNILGFAQFPVSDLEGLEGASRNAQTDGIVIDYRYFGSTGNVASGSQGRTTTHEIGHFLGLRHIWGDGDCSADDYVEDTPDQESETSGCPQERFSCGNVNMFQNYMDYTNDACMNIFTQEQTLRMRTVLENSERRISLLTSPGLTSPIPVANDARINQILSPRSRECDSLVVPTIEVSNPGTNNISSLTATLSVQGSLTEEVQFTPDLETGATTTLSFSSLNLGANEANVPYVLTFRITQVNGGADGNTANNEQEVSLIIPPRAELPLAEDFETGIVPFLEKGWVSNPDGLTTWTYTTAPGFAGEDNRAYYLNYFDYESRGERDYLYTPTFSTENLSSAELRFRVAYAPYTESNGSFSDQNIVSEDGLLVGVSLDCGATLDTILYEKYGEELATHAATNEAFTPAHRGEWRVETLNLDAFLGEANVQLVFIGVNSYGNNLYLDDISILGPETYALDLALARFGPAVEQSGPSYLSCNTTPTPEVVVLNAGSASVSSFEVTYQVDELPVTNFIYSAFGLQPREFLPITFEVVDLSPGLHTLSAQVTQPNLGDDEQPRNNIVAKPFYVDRQQDAVPFIVDFQDALLPDVLAGKSPSSETDWLVVNPDSSLTWEVAEVPGEETGNMSARIRLNEYQAVKQTDRLVSPTLNLTGVGEASLRFDVSYALFDEQFVDTLRVLVSTDCGQAYETVYELSGSVMAATATTEVWVPQGPEDWQEEFVDLSRFVGESSLRIAFEAVNGYGNNLYLDNIEFFLDGEEVIRPAENTFVIAPNPTEDKQLNAAFNLEEREDVTIAIYDMQGNVVNQVLLPITLNQTYTLDMHGFPTGVYILRVTSPALNDHQKFILN